MSETSKSHSGRKFPIQWRKVKTIVEQNGIEVIDGKGSKKKLKKKMNGFTRTSIIHAHKPSSEIEPCFIGQIIDKFGKNEAEFFG